MNRPGVPARLAGRIYEWHSFAPGSTCTLGLRKRISKFHCADMNASQALRPRRYSGVFSQPWDVAALDGNMSGLDISRPKSAPPVENQWFSQRALDDNASDETQSECVSSDSSDESSPPSTRPSS